MFVQVRPSAPAGSARSFAQGSTSLRVAVFEIPAAEPVRRAGSRVPDAQTSSRVRHSGPLPAVVRPGQPDTREARQAAREVAQVHESAGQRRYTQVSRDSATMQTFSAGVAQ